jgi:hypothetical protein
MGELSIEDIEDEWGEDVFDVDKEELKQILQQLNPSGEELKKRGWI